MSRTDHPRRAKYPEHSDNTPKFDARPEPRRSRTRRQALLRMLRFSP